MPRRRTVCLFAVRVTWILLSLQLSDGFQVQAITTITCPIIRKTPIDGRLLGWWQGSSSTTLKRSSNYGRRQSTTVHAFWTKSYESSDNDHSNNKSDPGTNLNLNNGTQTIRPPIQGHHTTTTTIPRKRSTATRQNFGGRGVKQSIVLTHERDYFRQMSRLESMDSYVLVSTLTASMSFGALLGFSPLYETDGLLGVHLPLAIGLRRVWMYKGLCVCIRVVSALSTLAGLYATLIFSLTILYCKSMLGAERDRAYDRFIRKTVRARYVPTERKMVCGCFSLVMKGNCS